MSSISWLSWNVSSMSWKVEDVLDKLYGKLDELAKLRISSMSWVR